MKFFGGIEGLTEREIWGKRNIPKAGPLRRVPTKAFIVEVYDGEKIKARLEGSGFQRAGRGIWEKRVEPKGFKKLLKELNGLGVHTATARKMHVYKAGG